MARQSRRTMTRPDRRARTTDHGASTNEPPASEPSDGRTTHHRADKRRIDAIFGDVLPSITDDERGPGEHGGFSSEHYRRNRPPHHVA